MATSDFEGAGNGRRLSSLGMSSAGPNNTLFSSLGSLRSRLRELVRNDPQIDGGLDTLVSNLVGMGISPRWQIKDSELKIEYFFPPPRPGYMKNRSRNRLTVFLHAVPSGILFHASCLIRRQ
ncbi:MAG: phage portal protein [Desulfatirhabdiaceae bacterium]